VQPAGCLSAALCAPPLPWVLDLGTGCGALLVSLLAPARPSTAGDEDHHCTRDIDRGGGSARADSPHLKSESTQGLQGSSSQLMQAVGLDVNAEALAAAQRNASTLLSPAQAQLTRFQRGSFAELQSLHQHLLQAEEARSGDSGGGGRGGEYTGFDVILCNPPFLSRSAARGRVTAEGQGALVAGVTGYEAYHAICSSVRASLNRATGPVHPHLRLQSSCSSGGSSGSSGSAENTCASTAILKPQGRIIFQISAAEQAVYRVGAILQQHGFRVQEVLVERAEEERGRGVCVRRGIVASDALARV
jgi:methylase of polypeptide subunit release factors